MSKRELLELLKRLLEALAAQETPPPRPAPAPERRSVIITESDMARRFIPYSEPRQWTVDAGWLLDRRR
jgi:hypothetical protein